MDLVSANNAALQARIRRLAALPSGTDPTMLARPQQGNEKSKQIKESVRSFHVAVNKVMGCVNFIESPINQALSQVKASAHNLKDPEMVKKANEKFQRIFGELFSAGDVIKSHLEPLLAVTRPVTEGESTLDARSARQLVEGLAAALPLLRSSFKTFNPEGHESAIEQEIQKQSHFLLQIKKFSQQTGGQNPEVQKKLQLAAQGAEYYVESLRVLAGPEYADRIKTNTDRALNEYIPAAIQAAKAMAKMFGAVEKAASGNKSQKRLQTVAKRIVLLAYLRSKSL